VGVCEVEKWRERERERERKREREVIKSGGTFDIIRDTAYYDMIYDMIRHDTT
jgi:hypothetical protein